MEHAAHGNSAEFWHPVEYRGAGPTVDDSCGKGSVDDGSIVHIVGIPSMLEVSIATCASYLWT